MKIFKLQVSNFRGIKSLDWDINVPFICLIGTGNSTKSTILEAINYVLYPNWNPNFFDSDFYMANTSNPIVITVIVGELPPILKNLHKYGFCFGGRDNNGNLKNEPSDDDEVTLTIQLTVDDSLEPKWSYISNRLTEVKAVSTSERASFGVFQLGNFFDREFSWIRGSTLSKLTSDDQEILRTISKASRLARDAINDSDFEELKKVASETERISTEFGASITDLHPALDSKMTGTISLHQDKVPLSLSGLGSRRLAAIGMQHSSMKDGSILLIDEIEYGLEPYRVQHLVKKLIPDQNNGQTFITTHSPAVLPELKSEFIGLVRSFQGETIITSINNFPELDEIVRHVPEAFLGKKIIVCEGKTEQALCKEVDTRCCKQGRKPFAHLGVNVVIPSAGGGSKESPKTALALAKLDFSTLYFGDSDERINPTEEELTTNGVKVVLWGDNLCTEQRVFADLVWEGVVKLVCDYINEKLSYNSKEEVYKMIGDQLVSVATSEQREIAIFLRNSLCNSTESYEQVIKQWNQTSEKDVRNLLGNASCSKKKSWFKSDSYAKLFAEIVINFLDKSDSETDLVIKIKSIETWVNE
jgi:predicted ATP-dependent endonuclease of OLD family